MNIENPGDDERRGELDAETAGRLSLHVAGLAESGLPLGPGLRALAEESSDGRLGVMLNELADSVERGVPLEQAVEAGTARIPPRLRGIIRAGLRTGDLGTIVGRFTAVADLGAGLRKTFWVGLAYPAFAVALAGLLFILVDHLIVERFEAIFRDFGVSLPILTILMIRASHALRYSWPVLVGLPLLILGGSAAFGLFLPRADRNSLFARMPLIGSLWRFTAWAEFCHLLALLIEAKLPLPEALRLTGEGLENRDFELACRAIARGVESGQSLSSAMAGTAPAALAAGPFDHLGGKKSEGSPEVELAGDEGPRLGDLMDVEAGRRAIRRAIPPGLPSLLRWAESNAAIAEVLHMAGETFQSRSRMEAKFSGSVIAFLAMAGVLAGLFILVIGLFLPLITLVSKLSG